MDQGVLVEAHGPVLSVGRRDDTQPAAAFSGGEALLLAGGREPGLRGAQPYLEAMRPVDGRRVRLAVPDAPAGGHALKLACLDDARATGRVLVGERALVDVGDNLCVVMPVKRNARTRARGEVVLVQDLEISETVGERVGAVLRGEREPHILFTTFDVATLIVPAQSDHRPAPSSLSPASHGDLLAHPSVMSGCSELGQARRPAIAATTTGHIHVAQGEQAAGHHPSCEHIVGHPRDPGTSSRHAPGSR